MYVWPACLPVVPRNTAGGGWGGETEGLHCTRFRRNTVPEEGAFPLCAPHTHTRTHMKLRICHALQAPMDCAFISSLFPFPLSPHSPSFIGTGTPHRKMQSARTFALSSLFLRLFVCLFVCFGSRASLGAPQTWSKHTHGANAKVHTACWLFLCLAGSSPTANNRQK
jgi:hypothetical protein